MIPRDNPFRHFDRTVQEIFGLLSDQDQKGLGKAFQVPSADQSVEDDELVITIDLFSANKEDIEASVRERRNRQYLMIAAESSETNIQRQFRQNIPLKQRVEPEFSETTYNNGILTIRIKLDDSDNKGTRIQID
jgi:HSP20 family molecular chaperone IbpA